MKRTLTYLVLYTSRLERMKALFEACGFEPKEEKHGTGPLHYSLTLGEGPVVELYPSPTTLSLSQKLRLGFEVKAIDPIIERLAAIGITPKSDKTSTRIDGGDAQYRAILIEGPEHQIFEFSQQV